MSELRTELLDGVPTYRMDELVPKEELERRARYVEEAASAAHEALYLGFHEGDPRVVVFDDAHSDQTGQYISFKDAQGDPCYGPWDAKNPATDIGLRGANPQFEGVLNPTTVLHADSHAFADYYQRQAPPIVLEALAAVVMFNNFIIKRAAIPYLEQVAEAFGKDPAAYVTKFFPAGKRPCTLTRAILYHLNPPQGARPVSKVDGAELLIKEHSDKSSYTIDSRQTSKGLQYFVDGIWRDARTEVACFRGTADDELTESEKGSLTPPTVHRAIVREDLPDVISPELAKKGLARIALPTFISLSTEGARIVRPNSTETHPTA